MEETIERDKRIKQRVSDTFLNYFANQGYVKTPSVPFITEDKSILFTNATIIPWKKYILREALFGEGVCMKQPCLRLHALSDPIQRGVEYETSFVRFLGYFNMLGLLTKPENGEKASGDIIKLLIEQYNIPKEKIRVMSSKKDDFIKSLDGIVDIEYDTKQESFYHWDYGITGVYGRGATFCLRQKDDAFREIGQLIRIESPNSQGFFEFGFGIETFLSRLESRQDYSAWTIFHCLPNEYRFKTLLDLTSCFGATSAIDPELLGNKHRKEIKRLAKRIVHAERVFKIPEGLLEDSINKFINLEFNHNPKSYVHEQLNEARKEI